MRENLRQAGFFMLGIFSLLYVIFWSRFAEIHVQIPFLGFPVFVGEILLAICLMLSFFIFDLPSIKGWQWAVVCYFVCVILKVFWGYSLWGPLALRHAALFYYPIFIFFGFIFYKRDFLYEPIKIFLVFLILTLSLTQYFYVYCRYWTLTLWIIAFILTGSLRHRTMKYFFYAGLLSVVLICYKDLIMTSRTFIVGNIAAVVFMIIALLLTAKIRIFYKAVIAGTILMLLAAFVFKHSFLNASGTIVDINGTISMYEAYDANIKIRRPYYVPHVLKNVKLFNPNEQQPSPALIKHKKIQEKMPEAMGGSAGTEVIKKDIIVPANARDLEGAYCTTLFRLFIWRDMIVEFSRHWPILGFSFGKPFRSESLEILEWGVDEWGRDGWIDPHNSYLDILYRMGILGVVLIGFLIWQFCHMVKGFIMFRSLPGLLLCSILVNWSVAANFLPILELPHSAIPFWALWGVALGYLKELKDQQAKVI